ncbi:MAG: hypothetical protein OXF20_09375, partial [Gammaproteobacteria bacterium]|nr:hypothetical protein [Gammaproteobacteria bacterium]
LADRQASGHQNLDLASFIVGQLAVALAHDSSPLCLTWRLSSARWPFATRRRPTGCCTSEWNWGSIRHLQCMLMNRQLHCGEQTCSDGGLPYHKENTILTKT